MADESQDPRLVVYLPYRSHLLDCLKSGYGPAGALEQKPTVLNEVAKRKEQLGRRGRGSHVAPSFDSIAPYDEKIGFADSSPKLMRPASSSHIGAKIMCCVTAWMSRCMRSIGQST